MSEDKQIGKALRKLEYGIYVVTLGKGNKGNAFTASWVSQISSEPPIVALSINNKHQSCPQLSEHGAFVVHLLAEGQDAFARRYYGPAESGYEKLANAGITESPATGSPLISGTVGYLDCKVIASHAAGNHTVFFGEVKSALVEKDEKVMTSSNSKLKYAG